jgi:hypothetical protein
MSSEQSVPTVELFEYLILFLLLAVDQIMLNRIKFTPNCGSLGRMTSGKLIKPPEIATKTTSKLLH